jgi:hypothetical protein
MRIRLRGHVTFAARCARFVCAIFSWPTAGRHDPMQLSGSPYTSRRHGPAPCGPVALFDATAQLYPMAAGSHGLKFASADEAIGVGLRREHPTRPPWDARTRPKIQPRFLSWRVLLAVLDRMAVGYGAFRVTSHAERLTIGPSAIL